MLYTIVKAKGGLQIALTSGLKASVTALGEFLAEMVQFGVDVYQQDLRSKCGKQLCRINSADLCKQVRLPIFLDSNVAPA